MAKKTSGLIAPTKKKVKNKGVHTKNKNSSHKSSKNYKKKYRGQGR
tara:strand:- start:135 stop:272 length:138 start_codon:yes stop_codon:yes gene_type:complete